MQKKTLLLKWKHCPLILHGTEESDYYFVFFRGATAQLGLGSLIVETFRSHTIKADSQIACRAHAVPLPCRAAKGLECVFPI
jgi:hypothetical protein